MVRGIHVTSLASEASIGIGQVPRSFCLSVGRFVYPLVMNVYLAKTADLIEMQLGVWVRWAHDRDNAHLRDYLTVRRLILHMSPNQRTKFEVSSLSRFRYFLG